jgi:tRNA A-37 threonylcarbamoyl transferase component Bud32
MGEVYRTRDVRLQRFAAIKVIKPDAADDELVRRFETEALSASALNHPNILTVYEFGVHEGLHYLATEFIEGETLRARLKRGALPVRGAVDIALQAASALEAAHEAGLIHRDIKPENIMIRPDGYVKVLDFGLAKLAPGTAAAAENMTVSLRTTPGVILGTVGYMAPEQVRGGEIDQRADLWSLGTVLHEMVSGESPFAGQTVGDVIAAVLDRQPPPLTATGVHVPPELERIVTKALSKTVDDRYQTSTDLLIDLRRLKTQLDREAEGQPSQVVTAGPATVVHDRAARSPRAAIIAGIAAVMIAASGWAVWKAQQAPVEPPSAPVPTRAFEFWLTVQHTRDGKPDGQEFPSSPAVVFIRGSRFTVNFVGPEPGYLYLLNDGPGDKGRVLHHLHPTALTAGSTRIPGGQVVQTGANYMDTNAGTEDLWVVWSKNEVPELEASRKYADTTHFGTVQDEALANRVRALLTEHSKNVVAEERKDPSGSFKRMVVRGPGDIIPFMAPLAHH